MTDAQGATTTIGTVALVIVGALLLAFLTEASPKLGGGFLAVVVLVMLGKIITGS